MAIKAMNENRPIKLYIPVICTRSNKKGKYEQKQAIQNVYAGRLHDIQFRKKNTIQIIYDGYFHKIQ